VLSSSEGSPFKLPGDFVGKVALRITPRSIRKDGQLCYSEIVRIDPSSPFHLRPCEASSRLGRPGAIPGEALGANPHPPGVEPSATLRTLPSRNERRHEELQRNSPLGFLKQAPAGVRVDRITAGRVQLTWAALSGAHHYRIEMAKDTDEHFRRVADVPAGRIFATLLGAHGSYRFRIKACARNDTYSAPSQEVQSAAPRLFGGQGPFKAKAGRLMANAVRLSWAKVSGADHYLVESSHDAGEFWQCSLRAGRPRFVHFYRFARIRRAPLPHSRLCSTRCCSGYSTEAVIEGARPFSGATPHNLRARRVEQTLIQLSWAGVPGASHYKIQMA
jgi:hypothetical protein